MALSKVYEGIRDGSNVLFNMVWAKLASGPSAATPSDYVVPAHALLNTSEALINPATEDGNLATLASVLGAKADAKSTATDTTAISVMSVLKQVSASVQLMVFGAGTAAAAQRTTLASDDPAVATLGATSGAAVITDANGTIQQYLRGLIKQWIAGTLVVGAGSNLIGRAVADASAATGGIPSTARLPSAANSTNATNVKGSAGRVYQACGRNNANYDVFLVLYDSAANPPVPGSTTIRKKVPCPPGAFVYDWPVGLTFATGIGYAFTKLVADADTTVLVAADVTAFNLDYA